MIRATLVGIAIGAAVLLQGCSMNQYVSNAVNQYCDLPPESRAVNREAVAVAVAPNRIEIDCHD